MNDWHALVRDNPELARTVRTRLDGRVSYIATVRSDGGPRVHPVTPIATNVGLYVFMEPASPKGRDLRRHPRYALHCGVEDNGGGEGEVVVRGRARLVSDPGERTLASQAANYSPEARYILFALSIESVLTTHYTGGRAERQAWNSQPIP